MIMINGTIPKEDRHHKLKHLNSKETKIHKAKSEEIKGKEKTHNHSETY